MSGIRVRSRLDPAFAVVALLVLFVFLPKLLFADTWLYTEVLTLDVLYRVGCSVKILVLWSGFALAIRVARSFGAGDGARRGWTLVAAWLLAWAVAQSLLGIYQIGDGTGAPFPSWGDLFFLLGYAPAIVAFTLLARALVATGMVGSWRRHLLFAVVAALPGVVLLVLALVPVLTADSTPAEMALNVAYPTLDVITLVPALVLLRLGAMLRGGPLFLVWGLLSSGLIALIAGDLFYAWFSTLSFSALDPLLDVSYVVAYALIARAVYQQHRVSVAV